MKTYSSQKLQWATLQQLYQKGYNFCSHCYMDRGTWRNKESLSFAASSCACIWLMSIRTVDINIHTYRSFNSQSINRKVKFNKYLPCDIWNAQSNVAGDVMVCHWTCRSQQSEEARWPQLKGPAVHKDCRITLITLNIRLYTPCTLHLNLENLSATL